MSGLRTMMNDELYPRFDWTIYDQLQRTLCRAHQEQFDNCSFSCPQLPLLLDSDLLTSTSASPSEKVWRFVGTAIDPVHPICSNELPKNCHIVGFKLHFTLCQRPGSTLHTLKPIPSRPQKSGLQPKSRMPGRCCAYAVPLAMTHMRILIKVR